MADLADYLDYVKKSNLQNLQNLREKKKLLLEFGSDPELSGQDKIETFLVLFFLTSLIIWCFMKYEKYNGKNIIWESKTKQVILIVISFLFTAMALWIGKIDTFHFWGSLLLFGAGGLFMLIRFLNPKNLFVSPDSKLAQEIFAFQAKAHQTDLGIFGYTENGFTISDEGTSGTYNWNEIKTVLGYKTDLFSYDEIALDVYTIDSNKFTISESTWGWFQFISRLSENIKTIKIDWYITIANPAFETNLTLLYDKENRTLEEIKT